MSHRTSILFPQIAFALRQLARSHGGPSANLGELEARILVELRLFGSLTMTALVEVLGNEKAQVSRTLQSLQNDGLADRSGLRAPVRLSASGLRLAKTIVANAREDAAIMMIGLTALDRSLLQDWLPHLWHAAGALLEEEYSRPSMVRRPVFARIDHQLMRQQSSLDLLTLRFATLGTLLHRSFFLACKRLVGMAASESVVLAAIWETGALHGEDLARSAGRSKAQTSRTANALVARGLVLRRRALDRHDWIYEAARAASAATMALKTELDSRERAFNACLKHSERHDLLRILLRIYENVDLDLRRG
jgi:DNA-binding MarR family transcriptional regulator